MANSGRSGLPPAAFIQKYGPVPAIWTSDARRGSTIRSSFLLSETEKEHIRQWMLEHLRMNVLLELPSQWVKDCSFVNPNFPGLKSELENRIDAEQIESEIKQ